MNEPNDVLSAEEMAKWLRQEVYEITKSAQLRIQDATDFVTGYTTGTLTPEEADRRWLKYSSRWGDNFAGLNIDEKMTDQDILDRLDQPKKSQFADAVRGDKNPPTR